MKKTVTAFKKAKENGEKLTMLTAYDYSTAKILDGAGIDAVLVGDSLGNVILGYESTVFVTMEDMLRHSAAVARGVKNALVVTDMPFMSYQTSVYDALKNAGRLVREGHAEAVKLEGGNREICSAIKAITQAGIPVMAHLGLTPQSVNSLGGYKIQGKDEVSARKLIENAFAVQEAGAFAVVLECVPTKLAELITKRLSIPTIGIGAGNVCDGQVLVSQDMLGIFDGCAPKFVRRFAEIGAEMKKAFEDYISAVKSGAFPSEEHGYKIADEITEKLGGEFNA